MRGALAAPLLVLALAASACSGSDGSPDAAGDGSSGDGSGADPAAALQVRPVLGAAEGVDCLVAADADPPGSPAPDEETAACTVDGEALRLGPAGVVGGVADVQLLRSTYAWLLQVTLDPDAAEELAAMGEAAASSDSRLAILAEGLVLSAPTVAGTLSDTLQLTGDWSGEQAERYAALLRP
jgi:hypothetical protein